MQTSVAQERERLQNPLRLQSIEFDATSGKYVAVLADNKALTNGLRLHVTLGSLTLTRVVVLYGNGQVHFEDQPLSLSAGDRTREIDPRDEGLFVRAVELHFQQRETAGRVRIDIVGNVVNPPVLSGEGPRHPKWAPLQEPSAVDLTINVDRDAASLVRRARVSPDGKLLAIGDNDGRVRIVDFRTFELAKSVNAHAGRIRAMDFSPDGGILITAGEDRVVRFWDVSTGNQSRKQLSAPHERPYSVGLNPDFPDRWILMGDRSGRLLAWDLRRNAVITNIGNMHQGPVHAVGYLPHGGGTYFSAGADGIVKIRYPEGRRESFKAHDRPIIAAGYSPRGKYLYTAGLDRTIRLWDPRNLKKGRVAEFRHHLKYVLAVDISQDETLLASGGGDRAVNVYDIGKQQLIARLTGHTEDIEAVAFTPDARFIVSTSEDKSVRVWSIETKAEVIELFFVRGGDGYVGITLDNEYFGDAAPSLLTVYTGARVFKGQEIQRVMTYLGRGVVIAFVPQ
jgi:WD40 repeat protein